MTEVRRKEELTETLNIQTSPVGGDEEKLGKLKQ